MFGKKRERIEDGAAQAAADLIADSSEMPPEEAPAYDRVEGPFDVSELADTSGHADFGALLVPKIDGLQLRLEADANTKQLVSMTLVQGDALVQVRALAAPRTGGLWETNAQELQRQIGAAGGRAEEAAGPFGTEVHATLPVRTGQEGGTALQRMRYVGVDGPRWLLMGTFAGGGSDPANWDGINAVFRNLVVVRGEDALPVGTLIQLTPLAQPPAEESDAAAEDVTMDSLQPGARITEVR